MTKKIGHALIAMVLLVFLIGAVTFIINSAETATSTSSGMVGETFNEMNSQQSDIRDLQESYTSKIDETSNFEAQTDAQLDDRGADASGIANLLSKNILVRLFQSLSKHVPGGAMVLGLILALFSVVLSMMFLRSILGDGRI